MSSSTDSNIITELVSVPAVGHTIGLRQPIICERLHNPRERILLGIGAENIKIRKRLGYKSLSMDIDELCQEVGLSDLSCNWTEYPVDPNDEDYFHQNYDGG